MEEFSAQQCGAAVVGQLREQVNNLMAAIQLLSPVIREQGGEKYGQYLAITNQSLYRLVHLMDGLELLRQGEEVPCHPAAMDLAGLCRDLAWQMENLLGEAGIRFEAGEIPASLLMQGDSGMLRRMVLDVVSDAIQASAGCTRAGLSLDRRGERAVLSVWAAGAGREDGGETAGTCRAVGLEIARRIAAIHGGTLVFDAKDGRERRAVISLPLGAIEGAPKLSTPNSFDALGGFQPVLVGLSDVLPARVFHPGNLE